jgi:hypothetical protein
METEKISEFLPDEKIESTIDMTFEEDIDEEMVSKAFEEDDDDAGEPLSSRDKEMKGEILGEKTSQGLFDETEALFDQLEREAEEPEVIMSDLEVEDDGIINLNDLERETKSSEEIDLSDLSHEDAEESDLVSLEDLEHESGDKSEIIDFDDLETEYSPEDETVIMDTPAAEGEMESKSLEELEEEADDETVIPLEEIVASDEAAEFAKTDESIQPGKMTKDIIGTAEIEEIDLVESEGGVDTQLKEFEEEKEAEGESLSKKDAKKTSKVDEEEEFDFDLDLESELEEKASVKEAAEIDDFELDLDEALDDLEKKPSEARATRDKTEEFDLDFDLETEDTPTAETVSEKESELGLDLDLDEFDLDLEEESVKKPSAKGKTEDFDLDFDLEAEDIELETKEFDLGEEEAEKTTAAKTDDFDLDLDLDLLPDGDEVATGDFDLDLDMGETVAGETEDLDAGLESSETVDTEEKVDTEEFDLEEIEDFLDFGDETVEAAKAEPEKEPEKETLDMDLELDFETVTAPEEELETEEIDIDLETMLDEEASPESGKEKEVALETSDERQKRLTEEYRKTEPFEPAAPKAAPAEEYKAKEDAYASAAPAWQAEKSQPNRILLAILAVIVALGLIYAGYKFFSAKEKAPAPVSDVHGKLQIEMIANPNYTFVQNEKAGELLVVTGNVTNRYDHPRSSIQVKGNLYDSAGNIVVTSSAYCGNMFTDSDLAGLELETINKRLANRKGDNNVNVGLTPGQAIPFTIVFGNLPADINEFEVEVTQSSK